MSQTHILHTLPDLKSGGGQTLVLQNIMALDPARYRHSIVYLRPNHEMKPIFEAAGATTLCVNVPGNRAIPAGIVRALRQSRKTGVSIVHSNNTREDFRFAALLSFLAGLPLVTTLHGIHDTPLSGREIVVEALTNRIVKTRLRGAIAVSAMVHDSWEPVLCARLGLEHERLVTIHPSLDLSRFRDPDDSAARRRARLGLGLDPEAQVLCTVGRLVPGKGLRIQIDMLAQVRRTHPRALLLIVGDGPMRDELIAAARSADVADAVQFLGTRKDIPDILAASDVFTFSSYWETFGISPMEAMAAGLPVVACTLPSLATFIRDGRCGHLVAQRDFVAMANRVRDLLDNPRQLRQMGREGRSIVASDFDAATISGHLAAFYDRALQSAGTLPLRGLITSDPSPGGREVGGGEDVGFGLAVSRGDAADVFEAVEEPLDQVAFAVKGAVDAAHDLHARLAGAGQNPSQTNS